MSIERKNEVMTYCILQKNIVYFFHNGFCREKTDKGFYRIKGAFMNIALIIGASGGMGREFARLVCREREVDELWLVARREDKLQEVKAECDKPVRLFASDVTSREAREELLIALRENNVNISWLFNCAGVGIYQDFADADIDAQTNMISLNCEALVYMTHICLPHMTEGSHIIQLASAAAFLPQPHFAVYSATKAFVLAFSRALNEELKGKKIHVTVACPGPVDTVFLEIAYNGSMPTKKKRLSSDCAYICRIIFKFARKRKRVAVPTFKMKAARVIAKILPHSILIKIFK